MAGELLDAGTLDLLMAPERWRLVSHGAGCDGEPNHDPAHVAWMERNTHSHPYREVLFVLAGRGTHGYLGNTYALRPGTVFVFDGGESHDSMWPQFAPDADHLWIGAAGDHFIARGLSVREGRLAPGGWQEVVAAAEAGLNGEEALACPTAGPAELRRVKLMGALQSLLATLAARGYAERPASALPEHERVIRALAGHIQETAGAGLSMDTLARLSGYSKYHFQRLFRQVTGLTVHGYVDVCRLERVRQLQARGQTQAQIAQELGFSCPAAFSRWYRPHRSP